MLKKKMHLPVADDSKHVDADYATNVQQGQADSRVKTAWTDQFKLKSKWYNLKYEFMFNDFQITSMTIEEEMMEVSYSHP